MERPPHLPPGTPLGEHYTVEGLVRLAEGRMFYLANDVRHDRSTRKCWECGHPDSERSEEVCSSCGTKFKNRRFLVSARWDSANFEGYQKFHQLGLDHPALMLPVDVFQMERVLYSAVPYKGEGLMVDEAAPLPNKRVLDLGQRMVGAIAYLHRHGVELTGLTLANLIVQPDNAVLLFDLEVCAVHEDDVPNGGKTAAFAAAGEILRRYCDIEADALAGFLNDAADGAYEVAEPFGRELEKRWSDWQGQVYPPLLGGMSDVGLTRQLNEDNWGWARLSDKLRLYVVADGMGGHDGGEVASELAVKTICEVARERHRSVGPDVDALEGLLDTAFQSANNTVKDHADLKGTDMGTTLVSFLLSDQKVGFLANVGDSRAYLVRNGSMHQISKDHSLVQKMVERGRITAEEARHHPHSNILLRTVGTERDIEIDIFRVELESGDKVMMCSDGLWGEVEDRDMETIMNTYSDPRIASRELVRAAHHGGGKDNVTLMIVAVP